MLNMKNLRICALGLLMFASFHTGWAQDRSTNSTINANGPLVIAFYSPTPTGQTSGADDNEALSDFQFYAGPSKRSLAENGIKFQQINTHSFRIHVGARTTTVHPKRGVGYYLIAPGKKPQIEYGVMTDTDLLHVAKRYFGLTTLPK